MKLSEKESINLPSIHGYETTMIIYIILTFFIKFYEYASNPKIPLFVRIKNSYNLMFIAFTTEDFM